jgi:inner membrane protein involved in colicin E2 resistance
MDTSLIDHAGEELAYILSIVLFLSLVLTAGFVTRNLENAIVFTILASTPLLLWSVMSHLP